MSNERSLIVFNINGTLLKRVNKSEEDLLNKLKEDKVQQVHEDLYYHYYIRKHIGLLNEFLVKNKIQYTFWSTMYEKNIGRVLNVLYKFGFKDHLEYFCRDHCKERIENGEVKVNKWVKDLNIPAKELGFNLENIVLIDYDFEKVYDGCNYFLVNEYDPLKEDDGLLRVIEFIKQFVGLN